MARTIYTIGFTQKTARRFFEALKAAGVRRLLDVRLNNTSQLAAFAKRDDLEYFLDAIAGIAYAHVPRFAPTQEILDAFKKSKGAWDEYETAFRALLKERNAIEEFNPALLDGPSCLLCSEPTPEQCHRRIVAEALKERWPDLEIVHLP